MEVSQQKLKILYLITKSNFGGAQRYVFDLATAMQDLGHDVVVGFGGDGALATKLAKAGVRTVSIPELERDMNPIADLKSFFRILDLINDEHPDVVHLNSSKMGGLGAVAARLWNGLMHVERIIYNEKHSARIIFTGHGWAFNEDRSDLSRFVIGIAHWITITLAHETIAVSQKTREQVIKLPMVWHKVTVVHNGIGEVKTLPRDEAQEVLFGDKKETWLSEKPIIIGTIAELHKNKGLSYAIEGMAQLKKQTTRPFIYVIVGEGEEKTALEQMITKLELEHIVYLGGYKEDAAKLLFAFDIFLLPSITEAFPYVILEAGRVGVPVIATPVGGIPEIIDDMHSGILIQSKNAGEITRACSHLIEEPTRRRDFGIAIKEQISNRYNMEMMIDKTLAVYTKETPKVSKTQTAEVENRQDGVNG